MKALLPEQLNVIPVLWRRLAVAWVVVRESLKALFLDINLEIAATLTYYGFLSLTPFLLIIFFLLGLFMRSSEPILAGVGSLTNAFFPAFSSDILQELVDLSRRRTWGIISIVLLLWSIVPFAATVRFAMGRIFKTERKYNFMIAKLFDMAAVLGLLSLFIMLAAGKIFYALKADTVSAKMGAIFPVFNLIVAPLLLVAGLMFFYLVFCPIRPRFFELLAGALVSAALLAVVRPLFGLFLQYNPGYGYAFGSLKTIFLLLVWIYYAFVIILFGAVVIAVIRRREAIILRGLFHGKHSGANMFSRILLDKHIQERQPGERVFEENDPGDEMFFVFDGHVDLLKGGRLLKRVGPGEYFGEMSMLINTPRTATAAVVDEDTQLVAVKARNFDLIMKENPDIVLSLLKEMADRLKNTDLALAVKEAPAAWKNDA